MSEYNINNMDFKQLRNEVQLLRDELAIMKRKYEDIIYNLDTDNFSSRFVKEQGDMRTAIEINAEGISTKVSKDEMDKYSTIQQTAESIQSVVSKGAKLNEAIPIDSLEKLKAEGYTEEIYVIKEYTQNEDGKNVVKSETYYYFNDITKQWEVLSGDSIYTVFSQTPEGFALKGNVQVDGSCVLTESLKFDSADKPIDVEYSVDGVSGWHSVFNSGEDKFMHLKIGASWSGAMKIVGDNGLPGESGVVDYSTIANILEKNYKIKSTSISGASIASPTIYSASLYSPDIYGENITLTMKNERDSQVYNNLQLTPTSMSLVNSRNRNEKEKFAIDLGSDSDNSYVLMRIGAGVNANHNNSLIVEKYSDYIKIGSNTLGYGFVGFDITPSVGKMSFYGATVDSTAKFA